MTLEIREFRAGDVWGCDPPEPGEAISGITATLGGEPAAYGGIRRVLGRHFVFFNILPWVSAPLQFHRLAAAGLRSAAACGLLPVYSLCDEVRFPLARRWHGRLAFREMPDGEKDQDLLAIEDATGLRTWIHDGF